MLQRLSIEQFVIIDKLDLEFRKGLTILTGETGAGKSILLDAMGLILGEPSDPGSIRQGSDQSIFTAIFAPVTGHPVWKFLIDQGLATSTSKDFTIHRVMRASGSEDVRVNGKPIGVDLLKMIGTYLVEIHGQFANQSLLDPANQLHLLDLSGGFPPEILKNVGDALREVRRINHELEEENLFLARHKKELPKIEDLVSRFEKIGMRTGFIPELQAEYARLLRAKETSEAFQAILAQLISGNGVVPSLSAANNTLARQKNVNKEQLATLTDLLAGALDNCRAAVIEIGRISPEYDIDTKPLHQAEAVLGVLKKIAAENKLAFDDLEKFYAEISAKLQRLRNGREKLSQLQNQLIDAKNKYRHHAKILTEKRIIAGEALSKAITAELPPLKLMRAEFQVRVEEDANMTWTELGINRVTFTARMNPGQPFSPVAETASGGELARLILALKVVLQEVQTIPTLVFDEVDTGIGGAAAAAVGERIALLADSTQVLVITHSPQVASRNDQHLHVSKQTDGVTTTSVVRQLTLEESTDEISRMLAGDVITPESHAAAKSLINEAKIAADTRRKALLEKQQQAAAAAAAALQAPPAPETPPEPPVTEPPAHS